MNFLDKDFTYYADLYVKLSTHLKKDEIGGFAFNRLNDIDGVLLLGLSACKINDEKEAKKIKKIALEADRLFSLLQLQNVYESNSFQEALHRIAATIRNVDNDEIIRSAFDKELKEALKDKTTSYESINYSLFKTTGDNLNPRFKRYFFARVEGFLAE